jgi:hypothetical protein
VAQRRRVHGMSRRQVQSPVRARRVHRLSQWHLFFAFRGCQSGHLRYLPYTFFISSRCVWYIVTSSHCMCPCVCICLCVAHYHNTSSHCVSHHHITHAAFPLSVCAHTLVCAGVYVCVRERARASASTHIYVIYAQISANARTHLDMHAHTLLITHTHIDIHAHTLHC